MDSGNSPRNPGPLYSTPRSGRETWGPDVAKVLARSGSAGNTRSKALLPVMPWQRDILDVACEIDPKTGLFWYRTVILIVVRQAGKTTLTRGKLNHRALTQPNSRLLYTAQDRNKGRQRLEETIYNPIAASVLGPMLLKPRWAAGSEAVRWRNGSDLKTEALSPTSGHGDTLDEAHIDEAFAHRDFRIEQNVKPTMVTVKGAQMWITSAAGDLNSSFLRSKMDAGRALAATGSTDGRTCFFEYSAPEDADPFDPETILNTHPGIGHIIELETVLDDQVTMDAEEFNRAYLGWWPKASAAATVIPWDLWEANFVAPTEDAWDSVPMWCVDVSPDREYSSVSLAARSLDKRCFVEVIQQEQGTAWCVDRVRALAEKFGGWRVALDMSGAAMSMASDFEDAGFEVVRISSHEKAEACGAFYDDAVQEKVRYLDDPVLNRAMRGAAWMRAFGGESRIFSRSKSMTDITPFYACVLARWAYLRFAEDNYDVMDSIA